MDLTDLGWRKVILFTKKKLNITVRNWCLELYNNFSESRKYAKNLESQ